MIKGMAEAIERKDKVLGKLRKLIGGHKFTFSDVFKKQATDSFFKCGEDSYYTAVSKKYLYLDPYKGTKQLDKILLDAVPTDILEKVYKDIVLYLWWMSTIYKKWLATEEVNVLNCNAMYDKLEGLEKEDDALTITEKMRLTLQGIE